MGLIGAIHNLSQRETKAGGWPDKNMFGFKRAKAQAFTDVLDEISPPIVAAEPEEGQESAMVSPSQARQPQDWLLQLLSGMVSDRTENTEAQVTPPVYEGSYHEDEVAALEDEVAPLLEAIANCEQDAIAEELGLSEELTPNQLKKLRRVFARDNHPDRLAPSQRDVATHRMTIANMLIDRQLRQKSSPR